MAAKDDYLLNTLTEFGTVDAALVEQYRAQADSTGEGVIDAMLAAVGLEPSLEVAFIENRQVSITAEKIAINAVLAGCKPEYMPVVVSAVEALADPL